MKKTKQAVSLLLAAAMLAFIFGACKSETSSSSSEAVSGTTAESSAVQETTNAPDDPVETLLNDMSLEEKVGQMFYMCYPDETASNLIKNNFIGGVVLFGNHFADKTADEVRQEIAAYQNASKIGMLIGVDEEGGTVVRASDNPKLRSEPFASPKEVYQEGGWDAVEKTEAEKADFLLSLGINVNNAPVCDITSNTESFIFDRSFSGDVNEVCTYVTNTVRICREKKLGTVLKHFPGYGDNTDTHEDLSYDEKPYEEFQNSDFLPFKAGIEAGADCIMVAHNIVTSMDPDYPASLSAKVHEIIRSELDFDGVIVTDDLAMQAITRYTGSDAAAVAAVKCGNDLLCCSDVSVQYPAVLNAVKSGEIPEEQINASVKRILKWKQNLGLLESGETEN